MPRSVKLAVVGDVHLHWDARDARALDREGYDLVLFVGDLAGYRVGGGLQVARAIAKLRTPTLVMPGNHDAVTGAHLGAEIFPAPDALRDALCRGMARRVEVLARALGPARLVGYGVHRFEGLGLTVVAARPHSIGGERIAFRRYLSDRFGVESMAASAARLAALFDEVPAGEPIVVLAHCGAAGLGATRSDIFGCDFRPEEGDHGDPDLADALAHAKATGKTVCAVVAGHMHHRLRGGGERRWLVEREGVVHVNAARVRRHRARRDAGGSEGQEAHHVRLTISTMSAPRAAVEETWLPLD